MRALVRGLAREDALDPMAVDEAVLGLIAQSIGAAYAVRGMRPRDGVTVGDSVPVGDRSYGGLRAGTRRAHADWAEHAKLVLAARYRAPLSLDDVARAVHCSPYHLCRVFRRHTGTSIHQYLTRLRLRAALDRLMDAGPDLTRLALDAGFSSHSHFTTAFTREFGAPPSTVRTTSARRAAD
jgi:AraC-like DNA-binding protein